MILSVILGEILGVILGAIVGVILGVILGNGSDLQGGGSKIKLPLLAYHQCSFREKGLKKKTITHTWWTRLNVVWLSLNFCANLFPSHRIVPKLINWLKLHALDIIFLLALILDTCLVWETLRHALQMRRDLYIHLMRLELVRTQEGKNAALSLELTAASIVRVQPSVFISLTKKDHYPTHCL